MSAWAKRRIRFGCLAAVALLVAARTVSGQEPVRVFVSPLEVMVTANPDARPQSLASAIRWTLIDGKAGRVGSGWQGS